MVSQRNRILKIINYLEKLGIEVNIGKNKAKGNKGFFSANNFSYRIDISKGLDDETVLKTLAHEFAHFVHYKYDKTLKDLSFIFPNLDETLMEELLKVTIDLVPKASISPLFEAKEALKTDIKLLTFQLKETFPNFSLSKPFEDIENKIKTTKYKYLLKHDRVKVYDFFKISTYSIENLNFDGEISLYLKLKSKQRALRRINSKISRLNKYYNSPTELFARSFEQYLTNEDYLRQQAPRVYFFYEENIKEHSIPFLNNIKQIYEE